MQSRYLQRGYAEVNVRVPQRHDVAGLALCHCATLVSVTFKKQFPMNYCSDLCAPPCILQNGYRRLGGSFRTLTEVFPCFFLSCKANARVILAKAGHGPHSSKIVVLLYVLLFCIVLCIVCMLMCTATG